MLIVAVAFLVACNGSKKGAWSDADKKQAKDELKNIEASLGILGDKKQAYIDCYLNKIEDNYESFDAAQKDNNGCGKIFVECMDNVFAGK